MTEKRKMSLSRLRCWVSVLVASSSSCLRRIQAEMEFYYVGQFTLWEAQGPCSETSCQEGLSNSISELVSEYALLRRHWLLPPTPTLHSGRALLLSCPFRNGIPHRHWVSQLAFDSATGISISDESTLVYVQESWSMRCWVGAVHYVCHCPFHGSRSAP